MDVIPKHIKTKKATRAKESYLATIRTIFQSWGIAARDYKEDSKPTVSFPNSAGKLVRVTFDDFVTLKMPTGEMPKWWILHIGTEPGEFHKDDKLHLISEDRATPTWSLPSYASIEEKDGCFQIYLKDRDGTTVVVKVKSNLGRDALLVKVLEIASKYRDVQHAWIEAVKAEGIPILLETKESMGGSLKVAKFRYALERGPTINFDIGESIL